jgi:GNAT superfamily N-acetyltransferase
MAQSTDVTVVPFAEEYRSECAVVLGRLPGWFGFEATNREYIASLGRLPAFVARLNGATVGFIGLEHHTPAASEILVLAVTPELHRHGIGAALMRRAEDYLRDDGRRMVHVKTLGPSDPDAGYARTRRFYEALGYIPLFETTALWGPDQPALILVKAL